MKGQRMSVADARPSTSGQKSKKPQPQSVPVLRVWAGLKSTNVKVDFGGTAPGEVSFGFGEYEDSEDGIAPTWPRAKDGGIAMLYRPSAKVCEIYRFSRKKDNGWKLITTVDIREAEMLNKLGGDDQ